jgi:hypothetical protein
MRRLGWLALPIVLVILGIVLFAARAPRAATAFTLKVGDCFDIPSGQDVGEVAAIPCNGPHDAEVFVAQDYAVDAASSVVGYPGPDAFGTWVADHCITAGFVPYVGQPYASRPDLKVAYLYPRPDAWASGERRVTCYLAPADGSKAAATFRSQAPTPS